MSLSLSKVALILTSELSYRKAVSILNLLYHRDGSDQQIKLKTISDYVEKKGSQAARQLLDLARSVLAENGFDPETNLPLENARLPSWKPLPATESFTAKMIQEVSDFNRNLVDERKRKEAEKIDLQTWSSSIESDKQTCCYISIDDIGVRKQKSERKNATRSATEGKIIENTVIHIQVNDHVYLLTATSMHEAFTLLLAFLQHNHLLERRLIFFTDGARNIKKAIETVFAFHPYSIILDWYHLTKKCREFISASVKGNKQEKQSLIQNLLTLLWVGNVSAVIQQLDNLEAERIKSTNCLQKFKEYLQRKLPVIPCYALRRCFELRLGSSPGEKANDTLVAGRQKHQSMSWSRYGSGALAAIKMLVENKTFDEWLSYGQTTLDWAVDNESFASKSAA